MGQMEQPQITAIIRPAQAIQRMLDQIRADLVKDRLRLLSLPQVAANVGRALSMGSLPPAHACQYLMLDPVLAAKLIRRANHNRLSSQPPACTCHEAARQLGTEAVFRLVAQSALREVVRPRPTALNRAMHDCRQRALKVSSISYVLACVHGAFDPLFASLAGLLHNIGEIAILSYAQEYPALHADPDELKLSRIAYGPDLGRRLLTHWKHSPQLIMVAAECTDWQRKTASKADYVDLVQAALWLNQLHERTQAQPQRPARLGAIERLGLAAQIAELSGNIFKIADQSSACAERALNAEPRPA